VCFGNERRRPNPLSLSHPPPRPRVQGRMIGPPSKLHTRLFPIFCLICKCSSGLPFARVLWVTPSDNARCTHALDPQGASLHTPARILSASIRQGSPCTVPLWKGGVFFARFGSLASISFRDPLHFAGFRDALRFGARPRTCVCHCARAGTRHSLGPLVGLHPAFPSLLGWFPSHKLASCGAVGSSLPLSHTRSLLFASPNLFSTRL